MCALARNDREFDKFQFIGLLSKADMRIISYLLSHNFLHIPCGMWRENLCRTVTGNSAKKALWKTLKFSTMGCGEKSLVLPCFFPLFHIKFPYYGYCYKNL